MSFTPLQMELLEALSLKVRTLTTNQLIDGWFPDYDEQAVVEAMEPLCHAGLLGTRTVQAHPVMEAFPNGKPVAHWKPGEDGPTSQQFRELVAYFQGRWGADDETHTVYYLTKSGAGVFKPYLYGPPGDTQWNHDIHVAEAYVTLKRLNSPEQMRHVIGEAAFPKLGKRILGMKDPDMFVINEHGQVEAIIEAAGAYTEKHIRDLHEHCCGVKQDELGRPIPGRGGKPRYNNGSGYHRFRQSFPGRDKPFYPDAAGTEYVLL